MVASKPHILLVGGDGGPTGVPRHMIHLAKALSPQAKVTLASDINRGGFDPAAALGVDHIAVPGLETRRSLRHLWQGWRGLLGLVSETPADLIWLHARLPVLMGRLALALRVWKPRARVAVTFHGLPFGAGHKPTNSRISLALEKLLLHHCPPLDLIFLSDQMADRMCNAMGEARMGKHRIYVLPNCSDLGDLPDPSVNAGTRLVMTGRVGWQKNYGRAAALFAHLPESYQLTFCGPGTDDADFQRAIRAEVEPEAMSRIHFAGPLQDVRPALMAADAYLLCSRYEGLPIGTLEAFEAGLPTILSRFDGAEALAATSIYSLVLDLIDLPADAKRIDTMLNGFAAQRTTARKDIQEKWAAHWSATVFRQNASALVQKLLC